MSSDNTSPRYRIIWGKDFLKDLKAIIKGGNKRIKDQVEQATAEISVDSYRNRPKADIKLISSREDAVYRIRIGKYRMIYEVNEKEKKIDVTMIFIRGEGYKKHWFAD